MTVQVNVPQESGQMSTHAGVKNIFQSIFSGMTGNFGGMGAAGERNKKQEGGVGGAETVDNNASMSAMQRRQAKTETPEMSNQDLDQLINGQKAASKLSPEMQEQVNPLIDEAIRKSERQRGMA